MQAYLFPSLAQAQQAVGIMDGSFGPGPYPKAGVEVGGGIHLEDAGGGPFITVTYAAIYRNAAGTQWAYVSDTATGTVLPLHMPVPGVGTIDLNGNWAGAVQVWP